MTRDDIAELEARLGVTLPELYRQAALAGRLSDPMHDDAQAMIAINVAFREGDFGDSEWRHALIAIGHDGGGNYFCIDTQADDSPVFLRDHETLAVTREYDNLAAFLAEWASTAA